MPRSLVLAVATLLLLTACGAKHGSAVDTTTSTSFVDRADQAAAGKLLISQDDLPAGWIPNDEAAEGPGTTNLAGGIYNQISACLGVQDASLSRTALASGGDFALNANSITSSATAFRDASTVHTQVSAGKNSANYSCIKNLVGQLTSDIPRSNANVDTQLASIPDVDVNDGDFTLRVSNHIHTTSIDQTLYTDLLGASSGRFIVTALINTSTGTPDTQLENALMTKLNQRVASTPQG